MNEDDYNFTALTIGVINAQIDDVKTWLTGELHGWWLKNVSGFKKYFDRSFERYSKTKTILHRDQPVPLANLYVGTKLRCADEEIITDRYAIELLEAGGKILVSATAGAGKSFFAKFVFLDCLIRKEKVPFLIELRNLKLDKFDLIDAICSELEIYGISVTQDLFFELLQTGKFILILDGYDEVSSANVQKLNDGLQDILLKIDACGVLVTSRPDEKLEFFPGFRNFCVSPLNLEQCVKLISKQKYDESIKKKFIAALRRNLYAQHAEFASNPLLLTILLITYSEAAEIPAKMHLFYEQAFDTLFYKHDTSKGLFRREVKSGIQIDEFKDVLACVSASGYIRSKVSFSNTELIKYIRKAKKTIGGLDFSPGKFKEDLLKTVCILVQDGREFSYNHRSFQEYFAALFLINFSIVDKIAVYERYLDRGAWDNSLKLAFEVNREKFEDEFIYPTIIKILDSAKSDPITLLSLYFKSLHFTWAGTTRIKGKLAQPSRKNKQPRYNIGENTKCWNFQQLIERLYETKKGRLKLSFHNVLTKVKFKQVFGEEKFSDEVVLSSLSVADSKKLDQLGITETGEIRLRFLEALCAEIEARKNRQNGDLIDQWL